MHNTTLKQALKQDVNYIRKQLIVSVLNTHKLQVANTRTDDGTYDTDKVLGEMKECYILFKRYSELLRMKRVLRNRFFITPKWKIEAALEELLIDICCLNASLRDVGNKVEFVADITHEWGERPTPEETVWLWRLRYPIDIASYGGFNEELDEDETEDDRLQTCKTQYVVTSASNCGRNEPETYVFAVDSETKHPTHRYQWDDDAGESKRLPASEGDWGELRGSFRGALDHLEAIRGFQRWLLNPYAANKRWRYHKQA